MTMIIDVCKNELSIFQMNPESKNNKALIKKLNIKKKNLRITANKCNLRFKICSKLKRKGKIENCSYRS